MFDALKVNYTSTMLGAVAALLVPIPIIFIKYGHKIREKSKFAPTPPKQDMTRRPTDEEGVMV